MLFFHFFFADEMHGCIVVCEVVGHGLDFIFNARKVRALFRYDKALSGVLLPGAESGVGAASDRL